MIQDHYYFALPENPETRIWRYLSFTKFVALLHSRALYFCRADRFDDPFEGTVPEATREVIRAFFADQFDNAEEMAAEFMHLADSSRLFTFVNCWHINDSESDAMWKLYSLAQEGIAIQSTVGRLRDCLDAAPDSIYLGAVQYVDFDQISPDVFVSGITPYIFKRTSFEHERELRAVMWFDIGDQLASDAEEVVLEPTGFGRDVPIELDLLIENVVVAPLAPDWFKEIVAALSEQFGLRRPIVHSRLYQQPERRRLSDPADLPHTIGISRAMVEHLHQQHLQYTEVQQREAERLASRQHDAIMEWYRDLEKDIEAVTYTSVGGTTFQGKRAFTCFAMEVSGMDIDAVAGLPIFQDVYLLTGRFESLLQEIQGSVLSPGEKRLLLKRMFFLYTETLPRAHAYLIQKEDAQGQLAGLLEKLRRHVAIFHAFMKENAI